MNDTLLLIQAHQKVHYINRYYAHLAGSATSGILLEYIFKCNQEYKSKDPKVRVPKIYLAQEEIMSETTLSQDELKTAHKRLKKLDFITIQKAPGEPNKAPQWFTYSIDEDVYIQHISRMVS